jgi:hypothetical protein
MIRKLQTATNTNTTVEYIKNGNFAQTICTNLCIFNTSNYQPNYVANWLPDPEIGIGLVKFYKNGDTTNFKIIELGANKATCVKQLI